MRAARRAGSSRRARRTARPGPGPRARRRRRPRRCGGRRRRRGAWCRRAGSAPRGAAGRRRWRGGARGGAAARALSIRAPSISSTICSSTPGAMSTTPTVSPSRSTVARSQSAEISTKRCEMKMTERPALLWRRTTSSTRSARLAGSAAVISSSSRTSGSIASARARSSTRRTASGMSRASVARGRGRGRRARAPSRRNGSTGVPVRRRFDSDVEIGDQRRLLVDRNQPGAARLGGRVHVARLAADQDAAGGRPDRAGEDLDQRRLAGAVGAHQRMHLARQHRERRVAQRRHGAVGLGDAGGVEERFVVIGCEIAGPLTRREGREACLPSLARKFRARSAYSPGPCRRRSAPWCRSSSPGSRSRPAIPG